MRNKMGAICIYSGLPAIQIKSPYILNSYILMVELYYFFLTKFVTFSKKPFGIHPKYNLK